MTRLEEPTHICSCNMFKQQQPSSSQREIYISEIFSCLMSPRLYTRSPQNYISGLLVDLYLNSEYFYLSGNGIGSYNQSRSS